MRWPFTYTQPDDGRRGPRHRLRCLELLAEIAGRQLGMDRLIVPRKGAVQPNSAAFPVEVVQQAYTALRRRAPPGFALVGPGAHLPVAARLAAQRRAPVAHVHRLRRGHLARVPQVALVGGQLLGRGSHQHLVGRLDEDARQPAQLPAQARNGGIDAFGVGQQLAAQPLKLHGGGRRSPQGRERQTSK